MAGQVTHCDFWFPDVEVPVGFGQVRTGKQLPVLTMVCGDDVGTAWTYVTGVDLPAQCSTELQAVDWLGDTDGVTVGARFRGRSSHDAFGDWVTVCEVVEVEDQRPWGLERHRPRRCRRDVGVRGGTGQRRRADPPVGPDGSGTVGTHSGNPCQPDKEAREIVRRLSEWQ